MSKKKKVLSKFLILCWATFIATLCHVQSKGLRLDTPAPNTRQIDKGGTIHTLVTGRTLTVSPGTN